MGVSPTVEQLVDALLRMDAAAAQSAVEQALAEGIEARDIVSQGLGPAMETIGAKFEQGEFFLPELLLGARATQGILKTLQPHLGQGESMSSGRVLIGTVEGDVHDIGKNIVVAVLEGEGFEVHDLGEDVPIPMFLDKAREFDPDVIGISALISIAASKISETIEELRGAGVCAPIIVGGAALSAESAVTLGADAYGKDAWEGARRVRELGAWRS